MAIEDLITENHEKLTDILEETHLHKEFCRRFLEELRGEHFKQKCLEVFREVAERDGFSLVGEDPPHLEYKKGPQDVEVPEVTSHTLVVHSEMLAEEGTLRLNYCKERMLYPAEVPTDEKVVSVHERFDRYETISVPRDADHADRLMTTPAVDGIMQDYYLIRDGEVAEVYHSRRSLFDNI